MRRIGLTVILTLSLVVAPFAAEAQRAGKVPRIGVLLPSSGTDPTDPVAEAFYRGLRDLGWVEGQNVAIERRFAENRFDRFPSLAAELVRLNVDVILPGAGPVSLNAARDATKTIPIVMVASSRDPIGSGLIKSYARPGGNITGLVTAPEELTGKQLELLREVRPGLSRVGILWDATTGPSVCRRKQPRWLRRLASSCVCSKYVGPPISMPQSLPPPRSGSVVCSSQALRCSCEIVYGLPTCLRNTDCRRFRSGALSLRRVSSWPMDRACRTSSDGPPGTSIKFSAEPTLAKFLSNDRPSSGWSSTSRRRRRSG